MSDNILCAVTLKDETFSDLLAPMQELDVSALKDDASAKLSAAEREEHAAEQARLVELATIREFLAKKKAEAAANPAKAQEKKPEAKTPSKKKSFRDGRGRPRKSFTKTVTFTVVAEDQFKLTGRGRPGKAAREKFTVHHSQAARLNPSKTYSRKEINAMKKAL